MQIIKCSGIKRLSACIVIFLLLNSCKNQEVEIILNGILTNYGGKELTKQIYLDYTNSADSGFIIPSKGQADENGFSYSFSIVNRKKVPLTFYYKVFYQNESYFIEEFLNANPAAYNPESADNFYGSWEDDSLRKVSVNAGGSVTVEELIRIVGNPRNEARYYGRDESKMPSEEEISEKIKLIRQDNNWLNAVIEKAGKEKRPLDEQLRLDAVYMINQSDKPLVNQRRKRNLRTGLYRFYILLVPENYMNDVPDYVWNIETTIDGKYINPLFFVKNALKYGIAIKAFRFDEELLVKAKPDLVSGIYTKAIQSCDTSAESHQTCHDDQSLYTSAVFEPYFSSYRNREGIASVPVSADLQNSFSVDDYRHFRNIYKKSAFIKSYRSDSPCPCENIKVDKTKRSIRLIIPGAEGRMPAKENTGVVTRSGFTYGLYTLKLKFPELINPLNAWNGLTHVIRLINESTEQWNNRRTCNEGYIDRESEVSEQAPRKISIAASEIDLEIRKADTHWPATSYYPDYPRPETKQKPDDIVVMCTNWDFACSTPSRFHAGVKPFEHGENIYPLHRWTHFDKAVSCKYTASDDSLFGKDYYYFQIEWKPQSITWRIGPDKSSLKEIAYMDTSVTSIPNNQMRIVISQEYHSGNLWPESPYLQEFTPFPSKEITGEILQIEIE